MSDKVAPIYGGMHNGDRMTGEPMLARPLVACRILAISKSTLFQMLADGRLPRVRIGKRAIGIPMSAIKALAEGRGIALPTSQPEPAPQPEPQPRLVKRPKGTAR